MSAGLFTRGLQIFGWLGINTVLGTMNALLISFYSPEPFFRVFLTAQLTTHVICILVEASMFTLGKYLFALGELQNRPWIYSGLALLVSAAAGVLGVYAGGAIHEMIIGFHPYSQNSRFYNVIFGSIIVAIGLTSLERFFRRLTEMRQRALDALKEARLSVLQERMRPHFLFNALNSLHSLLPGNPAPADAALLMLADSYRFLLGPAEKSLVSFAEEWDFCKSYVELMKLRFGPRLEVEMRISQDCMGLVIPPLSIQPLIENAFRHGVQQMPGNALVQIEAACESGAVTVTVNDNGPGPGKSEKESRTLSNIKERLEYHFGSVDVRLSTRPQGGAVSVLRFTSRS